MSRIYQYLDDVGDGSGVPNTNKDYFLSPQYVFIQPPLGVKHEIEQMVISIEASGNFSSGGYGNSVPLVNGISVLVLDSSLNVIDDLTDEDPIKTNGQWGAVCYNVELKSWPGGGNNWLVAEWIFRKVISLVDRQIFAIIANDDFTNLVTHKFMVHGRSSWWHSDISRTPYHTPD